MDLLYWLFSPTGRKGLKVIKGFAVYLLAAVVVFLQPCVTAEVLEKDMKFGDTVFSRGTQVGYYKSGKVYWVHPKRPVTVNGLRAAANYNIVFYPSGKVKQIRLASQTVIDGKKCAANYLTELYESGKLYIWPLAEPTTIEGIKLHNRDFAILSEDGNLMGMMIHQQVTIKGQKYMPNAEIYLNPDGTVKEVKQLESGVHYY